jgi:hypothetical protein
MNYSEAAYFEGAHVAHIAAWQDHRRVRQIYATVSAHARCRPDLRRTKPLSRQANRSLVGSVPGSLGALRAGANDLA